MIEIMIYRVCVVFVPFGYTLEEIRKWKDGQVHDEYPKATGAFVPMLHEILFALLGNRAPNISVVVKPLMGSGCYQSILVNNSDVTLFLNSYPIKDFDEVNPVQIFFEHPLRILSTYKVEDKFSIVYADLLKTSLKSFDLGIWSLVALTFFTFIGMLILRNCLNSFRKNKKQGNDLGDSPFFETFSYFIGQNSSNFLDRPGKVISLIMTSGFFFILTYYLSLMSTDLVVYTKPSVISNYRDIMNKDNLTAGFIAGFTEVKEFEDADEGSVQYEFWKRMKNRVVIVDSGVDINVISDNGFRFLKQESVILRIAHQIQSIRSAACKLKGATQDRVPELKQIFTWLSSDPEGKEHTEGPIMRQDLKTLLITKGKRRLRGIFESGVAKFSSSEGMENLDLGPMFSGNSDHSSFLKCMSDTVNYNSVKVERVNTENFRYFNLLCVLMFIVAFIALSFETYRKI